jgi:dihydroorotate dehydrogenase electron transfer subunit
VGARTNDHVFKPIEGKRLAQTIAVMTEDGSLGGRGKVTDVLPEIVSRCATEVVYAAGSRETLRAVAGLCRDRRLPALVAVEEAMACGVGLCMSCVVPVQRADGKGYDNLRACIDGPALNPARILWDRWVGDEPRMIPTPPEGFPPVKSWPG